MRKPTVPRGLRVVVDDGRRKLHGIVSQANSGTVWVVEDGGEFGLAFWSGHVQPEGLEGS